MGWDDDKDWNINTQPSTSTGTTPGISEADKAMVAVLMDIRRYLRIIEQRLRNIEDMADGAIVVAKGQGE